MTASLLAALASGCAVGATPRPSLSELAMATDPPLLPALAPADQVVSVGRGLRAACSVDDATRAPRFDFDRTSLSSNDRTTLEGVARCLTRGPLRGRALRVVTRPDPRGSTQYNTAFNEDCAEAVRSYVETLGVASCRIRVTSVDADASLPHGRTSGSNDRRIAIELAD